MKQLAKNIIILFVLSLFTLSATAQVYRLDVYGDEGNIVDSFLVRNIDRIEIKKRIKQTVTWTQDLNGSNESGNNRFEFPLTATCSSGRKVEFYLNSSNKDSELVLSKDGGANASWRKITSEDVVQSFNLPDEFYVYAVAPETDLYEADTIRRLVKLDKLYATLNLSTQYISMEHGKEASFSYSSATDGLNTVVPNIKVIPKDSVNSVSSSKTAENGTIAIAGNIPVGMYTINLSIPEDYRTVGISKNVNVEVKKGVSTGVWYSGSWTTSGSGETLDDSKLVTIDGTLTGTIKFYPSDATVTCSNSKVSITSTGTSGVRNISTTGLPMGTYTITIKKAGYTTTYLYIYSTYGRDDLPVEDDDVGTYYDNKESKKVTK